MKELIQAIRSSVFDPAFYQAAKSRSLSSAVKPLFVLGVIGIGISLVVAFGAIIPFAFSNTLGSVESAYPDNLVITVANGQMSINQPQPYYVKNTFGSDPKYLAIFDRDDTLSANPQENSTLILVKKSYFITGGSSGSDQARITSFARQQGTTTIDKVRIVGWIDPLKPYFTPVVLFGGALLTVALTLTGALLWVVGHLLYLFIPALLIFLFSRLRGERLQYKESYMMSLFASIPVVILSYGVSLLSLRLPFLTYTLLLLALAVVNIVTGSKKTPLASDSR
jgi:hypothetical protein